MLAHCRDRGRGRGPNGGHDCPFLHGCDGWHGVHDHGAHGHDLHGVRLHHDAHVLNARRDQSARHDPSDHLGHEPFHKNVQPHPKPMQDPNLPQ